MLVTTPESRSRELAAKATPNEAEKDVMIAELRRLLDWQQQHMTSQAINQRFSDMQQQRDDLERLISAYADVAAAVRAIDLSDEGALRGGDDDIVIARRPARTWKRSVVAIARLDALAKD